MRYPIWNGTSSAPTCSSMTSSPSLSATTGHTLDLRITSRQKSPHALSYSPMASLARALKQGTGSTVHVRRRLVRNAKFSIRTWSPLLGSAAATCVTAENTAETRLSATCCTASSRTMRAAERPRSENPSCPDSSPSPDPLGSAAAMRARLSTAGAKACTNGRIRAPPAAGPVGRCPPRSPWCADTAFCAARRRPASNSSMKEFSCISRSCRHRISRPVMNLEMGWSPQSAIHPSTSAIMVTQRRGCFLAAA
mmetsp:Transcript_64880/g.204934  ORF Transcript_64880/g.204934 Transcript_64880/m.204934 type:complete len:252 (+) Transcript_64880:411-1166(+)